MADLSAEVQALLNKANTALQPENIAAWAKAQNKPGYTVSEITGVEGFQNLLAKLQDMDAKIQAAAQSGEIPDDEMSSTSEKPVQNKVIKAYVDGLIQGLQNVLNTITQDGATQGVIDTFNEVKTFLEGISSSDTLAAKLATLVPQTRTINGKELSSNVTIGMSDIQGLVDAINNAGSGAVSVTTNQDGTFTIHVGETDYTINLSHTHQNMAKLEIVDEEPSDPALDTIYALVDNAEQPGEIQSLWIAGLEFVGGGVPAGTPAITRPSGTTINLGENSGSGVSKTIEIKANSHITGDLTVGLAANSDLSFDTTNLPSGVTYNSGAGTLTIAQVTAMQGVNITIVYSGSGAAEIDGGLIITGGGASPKSVTVVVTVGALDLAAIKLTGSQWLETDYYPNSLTEFELEAKFTANTNTDVANASNMRVFIGCRPNGSNPQEYFTIYNTSAYANRAYGMEMLNKADVSGQAITENMSSLLTVDHSVIKYTNGLLTFDPGGAGTNIKSVSLQTKTAAMIYPLNLGINRQASTDVIYGKFDLTIYRLTIKENNVVVRNYLPKSYLGVPGLYDTVNGVFISSKTSDEVVAIPLT